MSCVIVSTITLLRARVYVGVKEGNEIRTEFRVPQDDGIEGESISETPFVIQALALFLLGCL